MSEITNEQYKKLIRNLVHKNLLEEKANIKEASKAKNNVSNTYLTSINASEKTVDKLEELLQEISEEKSFIDLVNNIAEADVDRPILRCYYNEEYKVIDITLLFGVS